MRSAAGHQWRRASLRICRTRVSATRLLLVALLVGSLMVLFITVGANASPHRSPPLDNVGSLRQADGPNAGNLDAPAAPDDVLLEVDVDSGAPYVQARVRYRVRVLAGVPLRDATLSAPMADGALIQRIGGDRRFDVERDGRHYRAIERNYLVVPERAGPLNVTGPTLSAAVPVGASGSGSAQLVTPGWAVTARSAADLTLEVRPVPPAAERPWLPAEAVSISEHWPSELDQLRVGEPIERRIVVEAAGLGAGAIALPETPATAGLQVYAEPVEYHQQALGDDLMVTATLRETLVPMLPGMLELPAVRLPWWSLGMDAAREASLPPRVLVITAAPSVAESAPAESPTAGPWWHRLVDPTAGDAWPRPWLGWVLGLAWAAGLLLWLRARRRRRGSTPGGATQARTSTWIPPTQWVRRFRRACERGDAPAAREALSAWAAAQRIDAAGDAVTGPGDGLVAMLRSMGASETALAQLRDLDVVVYGRAKTSRPGWDGELLMSTLLPLLSEPRQGVSSDESFGLPPLFPTQGKPTSGGRRAGGMGFGRR